MNEPTDWTSAIVILASGLLLGGLFVFFFSKRKRTISDDTRRKDLEAKRDALIVQLRDPANDADERVRLEKETAAVLRQLDALPQPSATSSASAITMDPTIKGFLWGAGSVAALGALLYLVMQSATPRQEGGSLTGNTPMMQQQQPMQQQPAQQAPDAMLLQLEAAVKNNPTNLQMRNDLAQAYLERDQLMNVFEQTKYVLEHAPDDSRALTFQALVRMAMGDAQSAVQMLQHATRSNPKNLDAWVALAWVYTQQGNMKEAQAMIAEAQKVSPNERERLATVFTQMQSQAAGQQAAGASPAVGGGAATLPEGHPQIGATEDPRGVTVTLELAPSAAGKSGILFVMARNPAGGPPYAVKRFESPTFPLTFSLSSADSMMGQQLPDSFRVEARLDSDGNAATKVPTDPMALQENVAPGATVKLSLQ